MNTAELQKHLFTVGGSGRAGLCYNVLSNLDVVMVADSLLLRMAVSGTPLLQMHPPQNPILPELLTESIGSDTLFTILDSPARSSAKYVPNGGERAARLNTQSTISHSIPMSVLRRENRVPDRFSRHCHFWCKSCDFDGWSSYHTWLLGNKYILLVKS